MAATARLPADMVLPLWPRACTGAPCGLTDEHGHSGSVAYFHGCAHTFRRCGGFSHRGVAPQWHRPVLPRQRCSALQSKPMAYGPSQSVRQVHIASLARFETVVTGCASCTLMLKDYPKCFSDQDRRQQRRSRQSPAYFGIPLRRWTQKRAARPDSKRSPIILCHASGRGQQPASRVLKRIPASVR